MEKGGGRGFRERREGQGDRRGGNGMKYGMKVEKLNGKTLQFNTVAFRKSVKALNV